MHATQAERVAQVRNELRIEEGLKTTVVELGVGQRSFAHLEASQGHGGATDGFPVEMRPARLVLHGVAPGYGAWVLTGDDGQEHFFYVEVH